MKNFLKITFLFLLAVTFSSCEKDSVSEEIQQEASHTSLVYIVADNNLDSYPKGDLKEMIAGYRDVQHSKNNTLLVYLDDFSTPRLLKISRENGQVVSKTIKEFPEQNSLDVAVMSGIINQALDMYVADSYGLTLWSHGNGWLPGTEQKKKVSTRSFGEDDNDGKSYKSTYMDILDLKRVLATTPHLEYLVFDACNMQGIEVAYELRDLTNYIIASPVEVSAYGAPYQEMVPAFFSETHKPENIAYAFFNQYAQNFDYENNKGIKSHFSKATVRDELDTSVYQYGAAVSVVSCRDLEELALATNTILKDLADNGTGLSTRDVFNYDSNYYNYYFDLQSLMKTNSEEDSEAWNTWESAYETAVPLFLTTRTTYSSFVNYSYGGFLDMAEAHGISTFIPLEQNFKQANRWRNYSEDNSFLHEEYEYYGNYYRNFQWYEAAGWDEVVE
ncbi:clostripain-related cysteine peptidase [Salinimicrobium sp. GXAS 041]|uniref:clostripain-related cysteine peptidase n=1 Tax=Salinimicrobium sp. GXAS 041 TaxID=3400806 RepID=UPI003C74A170